MNFEQKVVLITGASSGIGATNAVHFASLGAQVSIVGRNVANLEAVQKQCIEAAAAFSKNIPALAIVADVTTDAERIIDETIKTFGKLDVLVNNAGITGHCTIEAPELMATYDKTMNTNLRSVFELTHLAVPHLLETKGNIINVSSIAGLRSFTGRVPYGVSKAALDQFTKCVSLELAPKGVRVNSINPALIVTNFQRNGGMDEETYQEFIKANASAHPLQRVGLAEDCSAAIVFLASDQASFITGTLLPVDGGRANSTASAAK